MKIAIPGDGPHLQKSIVDKSRAGGQWVRWGLFWASPSAGIAGWVLGEINLNDQLWLKFKFEKLNTCGSRTYWIQAPPILLNATLM